jgi:hypothetical protein
MKNIYKILFLLPLFLVTSCVDNLNLNPQQSLATNVALKDIEGLNTALIGAYESMQSINWYGRNFLVVPEIAGNLVYLSFANSNRFVNNYIYLISATAGYAGLWNTGYSAILRANNVINNVDNVEATQEEKDDVRGQALCIRALAHFDMTRMFAKQYTNSNPSTDLGVPIMTEALIGEPPRNTIDEVYNFVINDLETAASLITAQNMGSGVSATYRWSKDGANALLARVYLYKGDYAKAAEKANGIIGSGTYSIATDVVNMFAAPGSSEEIFTLRKETSEDGGASNHGNIYIPEGYGDIRVSSDCVSLYEPGDARLALLFEQGGEIYQAKQREQEGIVGLHSPKILRLSEIYLIRAEARANSGDAQGAMDDLNAIRSLRGASAVTGLSGQGLLDMIFFDRQRELAFEGHTTFDYWRTGRDMVRNQCNTGLEVSSPCIIEASSHLAVYPIPQGEIDVNQSMVQNDGY